MQVTVTTMLVVATISNSIRNVRFLKKLKNSIQRNYFSGFTQNLVLQNDRLVATVFLEYFGSFYGLSHLRRPYSYSRQTFGHQIK